MEVIEPRVNEYQRVLLRARNSNPPTLSPLTRHQVKQVPLYSSQRIIEWAVCVMNSDPYRKILAKSDFVLKTFVTDALALEHGWFQVIHEDWVCCPQCGKSYPKEPRYWWWRNKAKGWLWLDACRDCKCKTGRRVSDKKRPH